MIALSLSSFAIVRTDVNKFPTQKGAPFSKRGRAHFLSAWQLPRCALVAAIRTNAVVSEIVPAPASKALFARPFAAVRPFGSPALASSIFL